MTPQPAAGDAPATEIRPPAPVAARYLRAYLSDHLAVSEGINALAGRAREAKRWRSHRSMMDDIALALEADLRDLEAVLADRGIEPDPLKRRFARVGEKVGRLKGNGRLVRTSPLTRMVELDGLAVGLSACIAPWQALRELGVDVSRAEAAVARLERERERVESLRAEVARSAFAD